MPEWSQWEDSYGSDLERRFWRNYSNRTNKYNEKTEKGRTMDLQPSMGNAFPVCMSEICMSMDNKSDKESLICS